MIYNDMYEWTQMTLSVLRLFSKNQIQITVLKNGLTLLLLTTAIYKQTLIWSLLILHWDVTSPGISIYFTVWYNNFETIINSNSEQSFQRSDSMRDLTIIKNWKIQFSNVHFKLHIKLTKNNYSELERSHVERTPNGCLIIPRHQIIPMHL